MYCSKANAVVCYATMVYYVCESMIYYLALYNAGELQGDKLINTLIFCFAEISGVAASSFVSKYLSIRIGTFICYGGIVVCNFIIKYVVPNMDDHRASNVLLYILLVIQSFLVG